MIQLQQLGLHGTKMPTNLSGYCANDSNLRQMRKTKTLKKGKTNCHLISSSISSLSRERNKAKIGILELDLNQGPLGL